MGVQAIGSDLYFNVLKPAAGPFLGLLWLGLASLFFKNEIRHLPELLVELRKATRGQWDSQALNALYTLAALVLIVVLFAFTAIPSFSTGASDMTSTSPIVTYTFAMVSLVIFGASSLFCIKMTGSK